MSAKPGDNIVVVFLSYKWEDTKIYCCEELAKLTPTT